MLKLFALFANNHHHHRNRDALCANVAMGWTFDSGEKKKKITLRISSVTYFPFAAFYSTSKTEPSCKKKGKKLNFSRRGCLKSEG
jgi:hypothetical protein